MISKSNILAKVLSFQVKYKYDLSYTMLNKCYFSSANRLLRKNTGHGVRADVPTHAEALNSDVAGRRQPSDSRWPETRREGVKDWKLVGICSQKDSLEFPRSNQRIALYSKV